MRSFFRFAHWYIREITGTAEYNRYLQTTSPALSRRDYERQRHTHHQNRPTNKCC